MNTKNFRKGQRVIYIPTHAKDDPYHKDCQKGVVKSTNEKYVFVLYDNSIMTMLSGNEPYTAQATNPNNLFHL